MLTITDDEFNKITALIKREYGINLKSEKRALVLGRLQKVLAQLGIDNFSDYYSYVTSDITGKALGTLVDKISTNHTYFMREKDHFDYFSKVVLPYVVGKVRDRDLRIWCAASSTGEEAYTLAVLLKEFFAQEGKYWDTKILATDISEEALQTAKLGIYSKERVEPLPKYWLHSYFDDYDKNSLVFKPEIRNEVIYRRFNLMDAKFPFKKKFHVIFIRNVMIYFDNDTKTRLIEKLYHSMENGGYLFIGHSESIPRHPNKFKYIRPAVYRKLE